MTTAVAADTTLVGRVLFMIAFGLALHLVAPAIPAAVVWAATAGVLLFAAWSWRRDWRRHVARIARAVCWASLLLTACASAVAAVGGFHREERIALSIAIVGVALMWTTQAVVVRRLHQKP